MHTVHATTSESDNNAGTQGKSMLLLLLVAAAVVHIVDLLRYTIPQMHVAVPNSRGLHVHIAPIVQPLAPVLPNHVAPPTTYLEPDHDPSVPAHALTDLSFGSEEV